MEKYAELKFPMVYDSSNSVINAARDLADMERRRHCFSDEERAKVPLFLDPKSKKAVTSSNFCKTLKTVLTLAFGEDEAKKYGSHSFRIGGATILKMLGHSDEFIMAWGRWSSDALAVTPSVAMRDKYGRWISFRPLISLGGLD